jgi:hypothetical protein
VQEAALPFIGFRIPKVDFALLAKAAFATDSISGGGDHILSSAFLQKIRQRFELSPDF